MKEKSAKKTDNNFEAKDEKDLADIQQTLNKGDEDEDKLKNKPQTINVLPESSDETAVGQADNEVAELAELRQKDEENRDRLLRVLAEFDNYKKRMNRQMEDYKKYANELLLKELLSVVDNLERAITSSENTNDNPKESCVVEGVGMTLNEILKVLEKFHVTPLNALGEAFNPAFHEAVMQMESDEYPENSVINVLQKGYMIHDRLLRPAMVVVSKGKSVSK